MTDYIDLELRITPTPDEGRYSVYARSELNGVAEEKRATFDRPMDDDSLQQFMQRVDQYRGIQRGAQRGGTADSETTHDVLLVRNIEVSDDGEMLDKINVEIRQFGNQLFQTVFMSDVDIVRLYEKCLDEAAKDNNERVRVRLILEDSDLAHIPWEFLYDEKRGFVSQSKNSPIVRYVRPNDRVSEITHIDPPINIVVLIASPDHGGLAKLDVEREWQKLKEAVGTLEEEGVINLIRVIAEEEQSQRDALRRVLQLNECHIFHYIGHGVFNETTGQSELVWEGRDKRSDRLQWEDVQRMFGDENSVRLIVLNSCEGARAIDNNPFSGIAQQLAQMWVPAVVAMQFEITDQAAIKFAAEFYQALIGAQYTIEAAVTEGRKAIADDGNLTEWATPVLYSHVSNSQLFPSTTPIRREPPSIDVKEMVQKAWAQIGGAFGQVPTTARWVVLAVLLLIPISMVGGRVWRNLPFNLPSSGVRTYYNLVGNNECEEAWAYLSPNYQQTRHQNSPTSYIEWCKKIRDVGVKSTNLIAETNDDAEVDLLVGFNQDAEEYLINFDLVRDQSAGLLQWKWQIDETSGQELKQIPIAAGHFLRGTKAGYAKERPEHEVYLDAYKIDQTEVSNQEFALFVADTGYESSAEKIGGSLIRMGEKEELEFVEGVSWKTPSVDEKWELEPEFPKLPVIHISWEDANAFCEWRGKRLPTEAEWEKAARWDEENGEALAYPWGNEFDGRRLNYCDSNCSFSWKDNTFNDRFSQSAPVGSYPKGASPYGVLDMSGNVFEWVNDWAGSYDETDTDNPQGAASGDDKILRGGSWVSSVGGRSINTTQRENTRETTYSSLSVGFRCAQDG